MDAPQSSDWKSALAHSLAAAAGVDLTPASASLMPPTTPLCDYCSNLAFSLAKERKTSPVKLAAEWAKNGKWPLFIERAQAVGPYLNFHFAPSFWSDLLQAANRPAWGLLPNQPIKALIEFPSVNPNKPWHVGHLRNAILGDSIGRLLSASGRTVERMDYIDDLGLQVAQSVWGEMKNTWPVEQETNSPFSKKFDHVLGRRYVWVAKQIERPEIDKEVRAILKQIEEGHEPVSGPARQLVEKCVKAQYETAFAFGIYHDALIFESDIVRTVFKEGLQKILASGAAIKETEGKNAGCTVVKLDGQPGFEGMENADKVLIRSDGTATYTGKDVAFQMWKFGLLNDTFLYSSFMVQPNKQTAYMSSKSGIPMPFARSQLVINVIGAEQAYPQKVISAVLRQMGHAAQADTSIHLAYEHVVLPEGRFSGRKGTWMAGESGLGFTADELLHEMCERAAEKVQEEYSQEEKKSISQAVALAAIRFSFLRPNATQKIVFDYERALSFSGDSGPYIQYAYARASRILQKGAALGRSPAAPSSDYVFNEKETALLRLMLRWPDVLEASASKFQVHPIADFCLDAAGRFNEFYTTTPVLADGVNASNQSARLMMVASARMLLGRCMDILGLPKLEKM